MKKGILVVSFGTTYKETREKNIEVLEAEIQQTYQDTPCYRAFSSGVVRRILKERDNIMVMSVEEALNQMLCDGITHAFIQPTHIIDGIENQKLKEEAARFESRFESILISDVLLKKPEDYERVVSVLWESLCPDVCYKTLVFMGHGSQHEANQVYEILEDAFHQAGHREVYVATVEADPTIDDVINRMKEKEQKEVILTPFMLVAGDHAINDMAGEEDSYLTKLNQQGYETQVILKGLGEYEGVRKIYLSHLDTIMNENEA